MKRINITILVVIFFTINQIQPLKAQITRGAVQSEIYISNDWYVSDSIYYGLFHSTDNGQHISLKYVSTDPPRPNAMRLRNIIGDKTPGALYNYGFNELWVSFDYGVNWEFREVYPDNTYYLSGIFYGIIFKTSWVKLHRSDDFGQNFEIITDPLTIPIPEIGFMDGEFFGINGDAGVGFYLVHTIDYANTYTEIPIDSAVAFWQVSGKYPEISRGTEPGELYLVSWWPNSTYKIFHSIDTGYNWTLKYESEYINLYFWGVQYTAGREPGTFYVKRATYDPTNTHAWLYIDYSNDTAKTFTTYFHDLDSTFTSINTDYETDIVLRNYPNPFTDKTVISFQLPENFGIAELKIYNLAGKTIKEYNINNKNQITWNGTDANNRKVKSGIYFYCIKSDNYISISQKIIFIY